MINECIKTENPNPRYFTPGDAILDIRTSTNYWRTSQILEADAILAEEDCICRRKLTSEKESDEYDILCELASFLRDRACIITFSGTGFDIPHLKKKYEAYRMKWSPDLLPHRDLRYELKKFDFLLPLDTHRLDDYYSLTARPETGVCDAEKTLRILPLFSLNDFLNGSFTVEDATASDSRVLFQLRTQLPCPVKYSDEIFSVSGETDRAEISARLFDGNLRMYHTDYKNYMYLPIEGYALHKSLASYIAGSRKTAATPENCYSLIPFNQKFADSAASAAKYLVSVLKYCSECGHADVH